MLVGHDHVSEIVLKDNYGAATNYFVKGNQLYNSHSQEQSGFNILKIDLESNIERFFRMNGMVNCMKMYWIRNLGNLREIDM